MYIEWKMYSPDGDMSKKILMQKTRSEDHSMWILGHGSFIIIGLYESHMQVSTII